MSFLSGLFGGGDSDLAAMARTLEANKQARIDQGIGIVDKVYGGGWTPNYNPASTSYDKNQTYYIKMGDGSYTKIDPGTQAGRVQQDINTWHTAYTANKPTYNTGYGDAFYNKLSDAFLKYQQPTYAANQQQAKNALLFSQANKGLTNSSTGLQQMSDFNVADAKGKQSLADAAADQVSAMKTSVADAKDTSLGNVYAIADPSQAASKALSYASNLQVPSAFGVLANSFSGLLNKYGQSLANTGTGSTNPYYYTAPVNQTESSNVLGPVSY